VKYDVEPSPMERCAVHLGLCLGGEQVGRDLQRQGGAVIMFAFSRREMMADLVKTRGRGKPASALWLQLICEANRVLVDGCAEPCIEREKDWDHTSSEGPAKMFSNCRRI